MSLTRTKEIAMTRPSTLAVRRTAADLSDQVGPHLSHAKDVVIDDVLPKVKATGADALSRGKASGVGLAVRAGLVEAPKQRHPFRTAAIVGVLGVGAYAAWNAWRLPHASDDWAHADSATATVRADARPDATIPGVPADSTNRAF